MRQRKTGFSQALKERWASLRANDWTEKALIKRFTKRGEGLEKGGSYARNMARWGIGAKEATVREIIEFDYIKAWIHDRLIFLDKTFAGLETGG